MAEDNLPQASSSVTSSASAAPPADGSTASAENVTEAPAPSVNGPATAAAPQARPPAKAKQAPVPKDTTREIAETVVFVVVLVLLLKTFIAEAFVIPTGSMASTLWGYQKVVTCPECGQTFPVNCSSEVDPQRDVPKVPVVGCTCPNCRLSIDFTGVDEGSIANVADGQVELAVKQGILQLQLRRDTTFDGQPCKVKVSVDGHADKGIEDLATGMIARVRYKQSARPPFDVLDLDAVSSGTPAQKFQAFNPAANSGDRVLVAKFLYDSGLRPPMRHDVVVFKFPDHPQQNYVALNYIKRLIGTPGETIGIHAGKLYTSDKFTYPSTEGLPFYEVRRLSGAADGREAPPLSSESVAYLSRLRPPLDTAEAQLRLDVRRPSSDPKRNFTIIRKRPDVLLALSRIVFDNDHQPADLAARGFSPRWSGDKAWNPDDAKLPKVFTHAEGSELAWLHYRHLIPDEDRKSAHAQLITDFLGYNTGKPNSVPSPNWVGDLMLEGDVKLDSTAGAVWLEVAKGIDRFQARFNVQTGDCTLVRLQGVVREPTETILDTKPTILKGTGTFHVRFANVDQRLTLWVNDTLPFGDGKDYDPPAAEGPTLENDINRPAGVAVQGAKITVEHLKLWRDTYYTSSGSSADVDLGTSLASDPTSEQGWKAPAENTTFKAFYVQPRHYLCLGDNSPESSDGRYWGLVPDRLMLGRALVVYYPFKFPYWPLSNPENRVGAIH